MAKAVANLKKPSPPPVESVTLTLTEDECAALVSVLRKISGSGYGPRGTMDGILQAIVQAFNTVGRCVPYEKFEGKLHGYLDFKDY